MKTSIAKKQTEYRKPLRYIDRERIKRALKKYGISEERYRALWDEQNGACAICGMGFEGNGEEESCVCPVIDHDHRTGEVRGLLCNTCNTALGMIQEEIAVAYSLCRYIEERC